MFQKVLFDEFLLVHFAVCFDGDFCFVVLFGDDQFCLILADLDGNALAEENELVDLPYNEILINENWESNIVDYTSRADLSKSYDFELNISGRVELFLANAGNSLDIRLYTEYNPITDSISGAFDLNGTGIS